MRSLTPCALSRGLRDSLPLLYVQLLAHDDHVERGTFCSTEFAKESMAFSPRRTKISPREHRVAEEYVRGIFVDPRHRWGAGESTTETQSEFLPHCGIRTGRRDGRRGDRTPNLAAERSRDIHIPRGALNTEGPKNQIPAHSRKRCAIRTGYLVS